MANFLAGSRFDENREELVKKYAAWEWGFWRSFAAHQLGCDFYTSSVMEGLWIVPADRATAERLLADYGGFSRAGACLHDATSVHISGHPHTLVTQQQTMRVPSSRLDKAVIDSTLYDKLDAIGARRQVELDTWDEPPHRQWSSYSKSSTRKSSARATRSSTSRVARS
jgi:hypothetical protein